MRGGLGLLAALMLLVFAAAGTKAFALDSESRAAAAGIPVGSGEFLVDVARGPVTVYTYRPAAATRSSPIWIVMPGVRREAYRHLAFDYYDVWQRLAEQYGALLLVPEFTADKWPTAWSYNLGNVFSQQLRPIPWDHTSFYAVEQAFRTAARLTGSTQTKFNIFGHGAGAQFVQRYVLHTGGRLINRAVAANPGWYMLPDTEFAFPFGLRGTSISTPTVRRAFASDFVLLLGQDDVNYGGGLRNDPQAVAQGKTRYERGHFYFRRARAVAARLGASFNWRVSEVPGAGHEYERMSPAAAAILAGVAPPTN